MITKKNYYIFAENKKKKKGWQRWDSNPRHRLMTGA